MELLHDPRLVAGRRHELGAGMELVEQTTDAGELVGYTVGGPAWPACPSPYAGRCGGLVPVRPVSFTGDRRPRAVWKVSGEWPAITLHPSVACSCGGQHAYVRAGRWDGPPAPPAPGPEEPPTLPDGRGS